MGETSRSGYERGTEHMRDKMSMKETSHMNTHDVEAHGDIENKYSMKVVRGHRSALSRQIHEAVLISNSWGKNLLNSKFEYNRCIIPRLTVMMGATEKKTERTDTYTDMELLRWEENTKNKKRYAYEGERAAKRRKRWKIEEKNQGKRGADYHQEEGEREKKRRRLYGKREAEHVTTKGPQLGLEFDDKNKKKKNRFGNLLQMFENMEKNKTEIKKLNVEPPSGLKTKKNQPTYMKIQQPPNTPSKLNKNSKKIIKIRSCEISTPTKGRKKSKSSKNLTPKPKNEILRGKLKGSKSEMKNVQDIRQFFESGAKNEDKENIKVQKVYERGKGGTKNELREGSSRGGAKKTEPSKAQLVLADEPNIKPEGEENTTTFGHMPTNIGGDYHPQQQPQQPTTTRLEEQIEDEMTRHYFPDSPTTHQPEAEKRVS